MLTKFQELILFLDGKKAILSQLLSAVVVYLMATGIVDGLLGALLQSFILILTGGAVIVTNNAVANPALSNTLGAAIRKRREDL